MAQERDFGMATRTNEYNNSTNTSTSHPYTNGTRYALQYMTTNLPIILAQTVTHPFSSLLFDDNNIDHKQNAILAASFVHMWAGAVGIWLPCDKTVPMSLVSSQCCDGYDSYIENRKSRREDVSSVGSAVDVPWPEAAGIAGFQAIYHTFDQHGPASLSCASTFHVQIPHLFLLHDIAVTKRFGVLLFSWLSVAVRTSWYGHGRQYAYHSPCPPNLKIMLPTMCMYRLLFSLESCLRVEGVTVKDWLTFMDENHPLAKCPLPYCNSAPAVLCVSNISVHANPTIHCTAYNTSTTPPESVTPQQFANFMQVQPVGRLIIVDWQERVLCFMKVERDGEVRFLAICMLITTEFDSTLDLGGVCREIFGEGQGWASKCTLILFTQDSRQLLVERRRQKQLSKIFESYSQPIGSSCPVPPNINVIVVNENVYHGFRGVGEGVFGRSLRFAHDSCLTSDAVSGFTNLSHVNNTPMPKDIQSDMESVSMSLLNFVYFHSKTLSEAIPPRPTPPPGYGDPKRSRSPRGSLAPPKSPKQSICGSLMGSVLNPGGSVLITGGPRRPSKQHGARLSVNFPSQSQLIRQAISPSGLSDDGSKFDDPRYSLSPFEEYEQNCEIWRKTYLPDFFPYMKKSDIL